MFAGMDNGVYLVAVDLKLFKVCRQTVRSIGFPGEDVEYDWAVASNLAYPTIRGKETPRWVLLFDGSGAARLDQSIPPGAQPRES